MESDLESAELQKDYLQVNNFVCDIADSYEKGLSLALKNDYDAIITEVGLLDGDGFSLCSEIRKSKEIPIIFVSHKNTDIDKVRAFNVGADDYITKPFSPSEFIARIKGHISRYKTLLNKTATQKPQVIMVRGLKIDKSAHRVYVNDTEVFMPIREYELLLFLAENPNIIFSKDRLFDRLWGIDAMGDVSTVTVHIQRIREKIEKKEKYIETVWGCRLPI